MRTTFTQLMIFVLARLIVTFNNAASLAIILRTIQLFTIFLMGKMNLSLYLPTMMSVQCYFKEQLKLGIQIGPSKVCQVSISL